MTLTQQIITISLCVLGTVTTRALPFLVFSSKRETPKYIKYLGNALPAAIFGMLIVYCMKDVNIFSGSHGLPEFISVVAVAILHLIKRNMLISVAGGTLLYMFLVQVIFV